MKRIASIYVVLVALLAAGLWWSNAGERGDETRTVQPRCTVHEGHFVRNDYPLGAGDAFVLFGDLPAFEKALGVGATMDGAPGAVTAETFQDRVVFALLRPGLWAFTFKELAVGEHGLRVEFHSDRQEASFAANTPFVVSVHEPLLSQCPAKSFAFVDLGPAPGAAEAAPGAVAAGE